MQNGSMKSTLADRTAWFDHNSLFWLVQGLCWAITILIGYQVGTVTGAAAAWDERTSWFISGFRAVCGFLLTSFVLRPWLRREWRRKGYTHIFLIVLIPAGNPHFLFNALNSILAEADNPEAVKCRP